MRKISYLSLSTLVIILPLLIVSVLLWLKLDTTLLAHVPFYNDELYHWHQSVTFAEVGFNNGYYTLNENVPLASFSRYYAWGAWVYAIYGSIGALLGFQLNAIALINLTLFLMACAAFIALTRPDTVGLLGFGLILSTFIPLLLYLPSSMLQVLNLAIGVISAAIFYRLLMDSVGWRFVLASTIFFTLVGFIRPTYALYLPPMFALAASPRTLVSTLMAGVKALPLVLIAAIGFYTSAAPFPHFRTLLLLGDDPLSTKLTNFGAYLQQSLIWLSEGAAVVMAQRFQIVTLLLLLIIWGIYRWRTQSTTPTDANDTSWQWELALHLYNLIGFYTATITFHEALGGHDYRVMSPHLLFSLLLLVAMRRRLLVLPIIVLSAFYFPAMWQEYNFKAPNFADTVPRQFADWRSIMGDELVYDPDAPSPWCNTVTTSAFYVLDAAGTPGMLLSIDPGFGLSWTFDWVFPGFDLPVPDEYKIPDTFQSGFLILTDEDYTRFGQSLNLQRIERAPNGALYRNLDTSCSTE